MLSSSTARHFDVLNVATFVTCVTRSVQILPQHHTSVFSNWTGWTDVHWEYYVTLIVLYKTHIIVPVKSISSVIVIKSVGFVSLLVLSSRGGGGPVVSREQTAPHVINII